MFDPSRRAQLGVVRDDRHPAEERIRLRLALHAGEIVRDEHGVTSPPLTHAFRIMEAARGPP